MQISNSLKEQRVMRDFFKIQHVKGGGVGATAWHEFFAGVHFCGLAIFCVLRQLIFAIRTDCFFLLGINFCDSQKVPSTQHLQYFRYFFEYVQY